MGVDKIGFGEIYTNLIKSPEGNPPIFPLKNDQENLNQQQGQEREQQKLKELNEKVNDQLINLPVGPKEIHKIDIEA